MSWVVGAAGHAIDLLHGPTEVPHLKNHREIVGRGTKALGTAFFLQSFVSSWVSASPVLFLPTLSTSVGVDEPGVYAPKKRPSNFGFLINS